MLSDTIASHGKDIIRLRYQQETATINAILKDLDNQYSDEVILLGLTEG